mmetsp:Transcript_78247/g.162486  ORF Transcript_78247/g.162486 Transcript_78247/m.162486 type:complete len:358 (+) Transcript_78247:599-1672(+)
MEETNCLPILTPFKRCPTRFRAELRKLCVICVRRSGGSLKRFLQESRSMPPVRVDDSQKFLVCACPTVEQQSSKSFHPVFRLQQPEVLKLVSALELRGVIAYQAWDIERDLVLGVVGRLETGGACSPQEQRHMNSSTLVGGILMSKVQDSSLHLECQHRDLNEVQGLGRYSSGTMGPCGHNRDADCRWVVMRGGQFQHPLLKVRQMLFEFGCLLTIAARDVNGVQSVPEPIFNGAFRKPRERERPPNQRRNQNVMERTTILRQVRTDEFRAVALIARTNEVLASSLLRSCGLESTGHLYADRPEHRTLRRDGGSQCGELHEEMGKACSSSQIGSIPSVGGSAWEGGGFELNSAEGCN